MSRAFVKETDTVEPLPERPVSPYPNYVTATGLAAIDAALARLAEGYARAQAAEDRDALASLVATCAIGSSAGPARNCSRRLPTTAPCGLARP